MPAQGFCAGVQELPGLNGTQGRLESTLKGETCTHPLPTGGRAVAQEHRDLGRA